MPCHLLGPKPRNVQFFGRGEVMTRIDESLLPERQRGVEEYETVSSFAIYGLGGLGKTQTAIEYAHSRKGQFDAIFWVQADEEAKLAESFEQIAIHLGLATKSELADQAVSRNVVLGWLANPRKENPESTEINDTPAPNASWLLIFDNVEDINLVMDYWPTAMTGSLLITSRDPATAEMCSMGGLDLQPFGTQDAAEFLRALITTSEDPSEISTQSKEALAISSKVGGLPLALVQIAALIRRRALTIREFEELYDAGFGISALAQTSMGPLYQATQYNHTLFTAWALEDLTEASVALLFTLCMLDPDCVQEWLLAKLFGHSTLPNYPSNQVVYINSRNELFKSSLIRRNATSREIVIHRFVQDVTRAKMSPLQLRTTFEQVLDLLKDIWPRPFGDFGYDTASWGLSSKLVPHILVINSVHEKSNEELRDTILCQKMVYVIGAGGWYVSSLVVSLYDGLANTYLS